MDGGALVYYNMGEGWMRARIVWSKKDVNKAPGK